MCFIQDILVNYLEVTLPLQLLHLNQVIMGEMVTEETHQVYGINHHHLTLKVCTNVEVHYCKIKKIFLADPFEASKPYYLKLQSDVSTSENIRHYRAKSAQLYRQPPMTVIKKLTSSTVGFNQN